ncbi:MAG: metallophosphoesterase, partial [Nanoarchaeota archaeon]|nr:metallophosphoesterase [Nanoarchaeota archaeon]
SDIHNKKEKAEKIAQIFKEKNLDGIIISGDMIRTLLNLINLQEKKQIKDSLLPFLETGKPVYIIAGNHETKNDYFSAMKELGKKYCNLFDLATLDYVDLNGVNIFGVSGWDNPFPPGCFSVKKEIKNVDRRVFSLDKDPILMISHMPPKFQHKGAIDCVYWVKSENNKIVKSRHAGEQAVYQGKAIERINPINNGKKELTDLIVEGNIDFSVSGHYHMNPGANNFEKNIPKNEFSEKLFMSPGAAQYDMAGILTIEKDKAKYELLKIK